MFTKQLTRALRYILIKPFFLAIGWSYLHDLSQTVSKRLQLLGGEISCQERLIFYRKQPNIKVARYSFFEWIPSTFERKLCRHKQRFGKINTTVVLDKDVNLLWSGLQWHRSCHGNEMTPLPILLVAVFLGTRNCSSKIVYWTFFLQ